MGLVKPGIRATCMLSESCVAGTELCRMTSLAAVSHRGRARLLVLPPSAPFASPGPAAEAGCNSESGAASREVAEIVHGAGPAPSLRLRPTSGAATDIGAAAPTPGSLGGNRGIPLTIGLPCHAETAVLTRGSGLCGHALDPRQQPPPGIAVAMVPCEFDAAMEGLSEPRLALRDPFAVTSVLVPDAPLTMHCPFHAGCPHGITEEDRIVGAEMAARGKHGPNRMLMAPEGTCDIAPWYTI